MYNTVLMWVSIPTLNMAQTDPTPSFVCIYMFYKMCVMIICGQAAGILQSHNYDGGIVCQCDK